MAHADRVVVVGASGFGRECLDVVDAMARAGRLLRVVGVVDDSPSDVNLSRLAVRGATHVGTIADWLSRGDTEVRYVLGIGSPRIRRTIVDRLDLGGFHAFPAVHPSATLGARTRFGEGVVVCAGACISTNVSLGRHVHVNPNATIGHDADIGAFVSVNPSAVISGDVIVGDETLVGASATILQGLTVGARTILGAGTVLTKDVPGGVVVKGVPGRWR